jgi:hypothetical protein
MFNYARLQPTVRFALCALLFLTLPLCALFVTFPLHRNAAIVHAQTAVKQPLFSVEHGFYDQAFPLTLSTPTDGATIRYTLDFSTPSATHGLIYSGPIPIDKTTIVRAIAYTSVADQSETVTQSYFFLAQIKSQSATQDASWPMIFAPDDGNGPYPADYEVDPEVVNHPNNQNGIFENALRALPSVSLVTDQANLWDAGQGIYMNQQERGSEWERALSVEWIDPQGGPGFSENAGVRIHGQAGRRPYRTPKKSFRLYFKRSYGKANLDFRLFADREAASTFDRLVLRGGHNQSWPNWDTSQRRNTNYFIDQMARDLYIDMGHLTPRGDYVHLYLNGLYWGLYNITEHYNENYLADYIGTAESNFDIVKVDSDTGFVPEADVGDLVKWHELQAAVNVPTVTDALYQEVQQRVDVVNLADYILLQHYFGNGDWPANNWAAWRVRSGPDTRFRIFVWDTESGFTSLSRNITLANAPDTPANVFHRLMTNAEFRQLVADRFWLHLVKPQGLLNSANCQAQVTRLAQRIDQAIIGESARWGDYSRDVYRWPSQPLTRTLPAYLHSRDLPDAYTDPLNQIDDDTQITWLELRDSYINSLCRRRPGVLATQYITNTWYQTSTVPPLFSQEGGAVTADFTLAIANSPNANNGDIYYTVDGADPRAAGGAVSLSAVNGGDLVNVAINAVTTVKARVLNGGQWSPLNAGIFYPPQPFADLVINEIHYHPSATLVVTSTENVNDFEFIELFHKGTTPLQLDNVQFTRGLTYRFPPGTTIQPGAYLVLASHQERFQARYGFAPAGQMGGNLANNGEALELSDALGTVIDFVDYLDTDPWPTTPDGSGPSLSLIDPTLDNALPSSWAASTVNNGTPGQPNGLDAVNQLPTAALTSPTGGERLQAGQPYTFTATANDSDGTVQQVDFLVNDTVVCTTNRAPYRCLYTPTTLGEVRVRVRATDNQGAIALSPVATIQIVAVPLPNESTRFFLPLLLRE